MNDDIDTLFSGRVRSEVVKKVSSLDDDSDFEPLPENSFGEFGDYQLVGHGKQTNEFCGKYFKTKGCLRVELHNRMTLDEVNYRGKVYQKPIHHWCCKPSCSVCYLHGWVMREARSIEARLEEGRRRFGSPEHIVCSVPAKDYGLSYEAMRRKAVKVLLGRGVVGGVLIFHAFRYDLHKHWFFNPHYHVLGFILGGYARCRSCARKWNCLAGCGGFDDRNYQSFLKDGWVVNVKDERITVFGTVWYQLNHSSVKKGVKRFHVATWFGVCSYRKLKVTVEYRKSVCPLCKHDLDDVLYFGNRDLNVNLSSFEDLVEDGRVVWFVKAKRGEG